MEEHKRANDPNYEKKQKQTAREEKGTRSKHYLNHTIEEASVKSKKQKQKDKHKASFGWDVFNQDALYNAYKKRLDKLPAGTATATRQSDDKDQVTTGLNYGRNDYVAEVSR